MASTRRKAEAVSIGAVAVEDEGIFFGVTEAGKAGLIGWKIAPQLCPWPGDAEGVRYSPEIIESMIRLWFEDKTATKLAAIGISTFGLVRLHDEILVDVPRSDWGNPGEVTLDFRAFFPAARWGDIPIAVSHDTEAGALGEYQQLLFRDPDRPRPMGFAYVRAGAGVGIGLLGDMGSVRGVPRFGRVNAEAGHVAVAVHPRDHFTKADFTCTRHQQYGCLEGRISEKALARRCKVRSLDEIPDDDPVWDIVADYLAQLCVIITGVIAPDFIVLGGRTMFDRNKKAREGLFAGVRTIFRDRLNGYPHHELMIDLKEYIREGLIAEGYASLIGVAEIARQRLFRGLASA